MVNSYTALKLSPQSSDSGGMTSRSVSEGGMEEIRALASMMQLDPGLYCMILAPSSSADVQTGLPGVRITAAPGTAGHPDSVEVRTLRKDGWLSGFGDAALVRVRGASASVMVTIYMSLGASEAGAPNLQVLPLLSGATGVSSPALLSGVTRGAAVPPLTPTPIDIMAHIQTRGDVGAVFGEWLGTRGSGKWVEGFAIAPPQGIALAEIEYQIVLGRDWISPWAEGGQYCGSRGMALPVLGLRMRLRGAAATGFSLRYEACFVDGTQAGPVADGEACEAKNLSPLEAIKIELVPRSR